MLTVRHFREMLEKETAFILNQCKIWHSVLDEKTVPEEASGKIQVAVGQAQLLISSKFEQFRGLVDMSEASLGKDVTMNDLQGFWELMYIQVEDIRKKFLDLDALRKINWEVNVETERQPLAAINKVPPKARRVQKPLASVRRDFSAEAKVRVALAKAAMKNGQEVHGSENSM